MNNSNEATNGDEQWVIKPVSKLNGTSHTDWDWEGYIAKGCISLFVGVWKSGKTTLLSHLLKTKNTGGSLAGKKVMPGKVLIISEEPEIFWYQRQEKLSLTDDVHVCAHPFKGKPTKDDWTRFVKYIALKIKAENYQLVIVDSLANIWPVYDENCAGEVNQALIPLRQWSDLGIGVLLVHHPKKGDSLEGQSSRGSGAFQAFPDILIEFKRYLPQNLEDRRRTLTVQGRYDVPPQAVIELTESGYILHGTKTETTCEDRQRVLLQLLPNTAPGLSSEAIRNAWPVGDVPQPGLRTTEEDLKSLLASNKVNREGKGTKGSGYTFWNPILASSPPKEQESNKENHENSSEAGPLEGEKS